MPEPVAPHLAPFPTLFSEHLEHIDWDRDRLRRERLGRLRNLLKVAMESSPWHRERLAGLDPERITEDEIAAMPVMTKADLMGNFDDIVTDRRLSREMCERHLEDPDKSGYLLEDYKVVASGGSSGQRGVFVYGREAFATLWAASVRFQVRDWARDPSLAGVPRVTAVVAASKPYHLSAAIGRTFSSAASPRVSFPVTKPMKEIVAWLNELQPTVLMGYSSFLPRLAGEAQAGRLRIEPRRISAISEPLLPEARRTIEDTWRVPVANGYGMSEGLFTGSCGHGIHLPDDLCIFEPVDAGGAAAAPGETSQRVYLTNLYNAVLPLIRFEITDEVAVLDDECPCGSRFRRIGDPLGRLDETFVYPGGTTVHPHLFRSILERRRRSSSTRFCRPGREPLSAPCSTGRRTWPTSPRNSPGPSPCWASPDPGSRSRR